MSEEEYKSLGGGFLKKHKFGKKLRILFNESSYITEKKNLLKRVEKY